MTILKILLLIVFMCFSSKALGLYVFDKIKKDREEKTAIGFLANLTLFFICELPVMFFKLSSRYLNIFGLVYLTIIGIIMLNKKRNYSTYCGICFYVIIYDMHSLWIHGNI